MRGGMRNIEKYRKYQAAYRAENKERAKILRENLKLSEGIGVYKVVYSSGTYIGSGHIYVRRTKHLSGNTRISKSLREKVISFEVVCECTTTEEARSKEQELIEWYGLDNLLNTKKRN